MDRLTEVLHTYGISGEVGKTFCGPLLEITEFKPAAGTKIKQITAVAEDIKRELGVSSLRIESLAENSCLAFEVPAKTLQTVDFAATLGQPETEAAFNKMALPLLLGVNTRGVPVMADLAKMPHLLIGGTTGSGKSVGLNTFILSLMSARSSEELKFVLVDPKKIEFSGYNNQCYMLTPVVSESNEAAAVLTYLAEEMDKRYALFAEKMSRNISAYNENSSRPLPYIVCVIDEFADLMSVNKSVEKDVMRLAQKARAAGIHLILATQRPSVDVVTGVMKANFPARLAYKTASSTDSRTILDETGAENLIGRGDSLYLAADGTLTRIHGAYANDDYIAAFLRPLAAKVKPLPLKVEDAPVQEKSVAAATKKESTAGICFRAWRCWTNMRVKDRELIIKIVKNLCKFLRDILLGRKK